MLSNVSAALLRVVAVFEEEKGQALAEYGLILAIVTVASVVVLGTLGGAVIGLLLEFPTVMP